MKWSERIRITEDIYDYIIKNHIDSVRQLRYDATNLNKQDWLEVLKVRSICYGLHEFISGARRCDWIFYNPVTGKPYDS